MLLKDELVEIGWCSNNKNKYVARGYLYTKMGDKFLAKIEDVMELSKDTKIPVRCDFCGEIYYPTARNYMKRMKYDAVDCCVACKGLKIKNTCQQKYGVDNVMQVKEVKDKFVDTCLDRYGVEFPLQNKNIYEKTQNSLNARYGIENGVADLRTVGEIQDRINSTNMERYNGKSPFCSKEIRRKIRVKFFENGTCATSQKQIDLCNTLKNIYGDCALNYPCGLVSLDCFITVDGVKIDIEYDGWYWHKDTTEKDKRRDYFVKKEGYKILRFLAYKDRLPTIDEIVTSVNTLTTTNKDFIKIELR